MTDRVSRITCEWRSHTPFNEMRLDRNVSTDAKRPETRTISGLRSRAPAQLVIETHEVELRFGCNRRLDDGAARPVL